MSIIYVKKIKKAPHCRRLHFSFSQWRLRCSSFQNSWSNNASFCKWSKFLVRNTDFWSFWGHIAQRMCFSQNRVGYLPLAHSKGSSFTKNEPSSWSQQKIFQFLAKSVNFCQFWLTRSTFKVDFLNAQAKFQKNVSYVLGRCCLEHCVKLWAFYLQKRAGGGEGLTVLQVDTFQDSWV